MNNLFIVTTTRYNNDTWEASISYRENKNIPCIYSPPCRLSESIDLGVPVFVIEMNNSINQIMGIGLISNKIVTDKKHKVQSDTNYNRYTYIGKYHISRELLNFYNAELVYILDIILFKGYTHSKRGSGITKIPKKVLELDICRHINIGKEIKNVFVLHFSKKTNILTS